MEAVVDVVPGHSSRRCVERVRSFLPRPEVPPTHLFVVQPDVTPGSETGTQGRVEDLGLGRVSVGPGELSSSF